MKTHIIFRLELGIVILLFKIIPSTRHQKDTHDGSGWWTEWRGGGDDEDDSDGQGSSDGDSDRDVAVVTDNGYWLWRWEWWLWLEQHLYS